MSLSNSILRKSHSLLPSIFTIASSRDPSSRCLQNLTERALKAINQPLKDYGMLSHQASFKQAQKGSDRPRSDHLEHELADLPDFGIFCDAHGSYFDLDEVLHGFSIDEQTIARPLLTSILNAIKTGQSPAFTWDTDPAKKIDQIHGIYALCDYCCLHAFQEKHLEPFQEKFPELALSDAPDTIFTLQGSESEIAELLTEEDRQTAHVIPSRFRLLKSLIIRERPPSQGFLNSLPTSLQSLALPLDAMDMDHLRLNIKEIALAAVRTDGLALKLASPLLKADKAVVLLAVANKGSALQFAAAELRADREVVLAAVTAKGQNLLYKDPSSCEKFRILTRLTGEPFSNLINRPDLVNPILNLPTLALQYASEQLRDDQDIVLAAVKVSGLSLQFASERLQSNIPIVAEALKQDSMILILDQLAMLNLEQDLGLEFLSVCGANWIVYLCTNMSREDLQFRQRAWEATIEADSQVPRANGGEAFSTTLQSRQIGWEASRGEAIPMPGFDDKNLILRAIREEGLAALDLVSPRLRTDKDVVLAAVTQKGSDLAFTSASLKADKEVVLAAVRQDGSALRFAFTGLQADKEVVLAAVRQSGDALPFACQELQADTEVVLAARQGYGQAVLTEDRSLWLDRNAVFLSIDQLQKSYLGKLAKKVISIGTIVFCINTIRTMAVDHWTHRRAQ
ncbi:MAG: DUF4116 domain-containing protein [Chlamydiae bacterium]|nr:DUF4116 domain-containing protein [Chlamydiota bacterium]